MVSVDLKHHVYLLTYLVTSLLTVPRPHGRDCTWYRRCLEKQIPCSGKTGDYAIAYGEKFCQKYTSAYSDFSQNGKKWVDAVRKCLQVSWNLTTRPG